MRTSLMILILILASLHAHSATTKVGNGDDGTDLEGFEEITSGPIVESRAKAVEHLKKLNVQGVPGLGLLIPEVEKAQLYMAKRDVQANLDEDQGAFHADFNGAVFARTMPEAYAPTRFFPASKKLSEEQLISLHIHEALHRSLPPSIKENENKVAQMTIAITSPGASHDRVKSAAVKHIPEELPVASNNGIQVNGVKTLPPVAQDATMTTNLYPVPEHARVKRPSVFGYTYQKFTGHHDTDIMPVETMHSIQSHLYPFGGDTNPIGIGIEATVLKFEDEDTQLGPLGISARARLWSVRGFDIGAWGMVSLNTLSNEELKNSPYGRDLLTVGLSLRKDLKNFYVENLIGFTSPGEVKDKTGTQEYTYKYGSVVTASVKAGFRLSHFMAGGFGEIILSDNYSYTGPGYSDETGRYQIVGAGPDIGWEQDWWAMRVFGRFVVDSSKNADYTLLGNIMGKGSGQGSVGAQFSVVF
jgi:hypothetical protein